MFDYNCRNDKKHFTWFRIKYSTFCRMNRKSWEINYKFMSTLTAFATFQVFQVFYTIFVIIIIHYVDKQKCRVTIQLLIGVFLKCFPKSLRFCLEIWWMLEVFGFGDNSLHQNSNDIFYGLGYLLLCLWW